MSDATPIAAIAMPAGEYAIVEVLGHRTLVGRVLEVERFGTKMLQVEPLFGDVMLGPVLIGGSSIYQFTPCSADIAFARRPTHSYQLPPSVAANVPPIALPSNEELPSFLDGFLEDDDADDGEEVGRG
ncbi:hypothetical protein F1640_18525 [Novosphingobium sp. NBM11]|uniref:hypothetical protein n=1 Tax=Novosphingobium sp. NBM11 TaxID=2596914 RepID=UPI0018926D89|nr:hypothetical protein [Novosphingobium sp. NBM11]MBF5091952.1 hypothetical protein [Novosphingobium sp. NBM11]